MYTYDAAATWQASGLLLLRLALAGVLAFDAGLTADADPASWLMRLLLAACAVAVAVGYRTRLALAALVVFVVMALARDGSLSSTPRASTASIEAVVLKLAIAASVAICGPGTYSADARLFGRREIHIPPVGRARR